MNQTTTTPTLGILNDFTGKVLPLHAQAQAHMREAKRRLVAIGTSPQRASELLDAALTAAAKGLN